VEATAVKAPFPWQPLTPRGVAAFSAAPLGRLLLVQLLMALSAGLAVAWSLHHAWFPVISQAVNRLPEKGQVRFARLDWRGESPVRLAENSRLAISVDLAHHGSARSPAHVQVELGRSDFKFLSLFGSLTLPYPSGWIIAFNRPDLEPWWGAWSPFILALVFLCVALALPLVWAVLASLYCLPVWLTAFFADRVLALHGSWRLAGAALIPGALFLTAAILLYALGILDLISLLIATALHIPIGWLYALLGPFWLPRDPKSANPRSNPFSTA